MTKFHPLIGALILIIALAPLAVLAAEPATIPDYSETPRTQVPDQYKWRVTDLYPDDTAWKQDLDAVSTMAEDLLKSAPGWTDSATRMADFMDRLTELQKRARRLYAYAQFQSDTDMGNSKFQKMKGEMQHLFVNFFSRMTFLQPDILKLGPDKIAAYIKAEPRLEPYRISLERILREKDHILPADQQKIAALTGLFSGAASKASSMLNNMDIPRPEVTLHDGTKVTLNYANYSKYRGSSNTADRRLVMEAYWKNQAQYENTFAILMDAGMKQQLFNARIHNYPTCLDAALFDNNIDPEVYHNLIKTVREHVAPLQRLLKLRKKLLGLKDMTYGDVYASAVPSVSRTFTYPEAKQLVLDAMAPLGSEYTDVLKQAFDKGWIDLYPNKGKQSGAYSSGVYGVHPYVKLNFDGSYNSVSTLAHELGHAMHSYFSTHNQSYSNSQYPIFLAEIASTFNENMLMHQLLKSNADDRFKLLVLDGYLEQLRGTLYRQTLFAEFELAMHEQVEKGKTLTPDWLDNKYLELTRAYYGHDQGVMDVEDYIKNEWSGIPHFYMNYYVFQYSTGIVSSMALADMVLNGGPAERQRYLDFLKAGGSQFPLDTLRQAGVDMRTPQPIVAALNQFDTLVGEMETIVARLETEHK